MAVMLFATTGCVTSSVESPIEDSATLPEKMDTQKKEQEKNKSKENSLKNKNLAKDMKEKTALSPSNSLAGVDVDVSSSDSSGLSVLGPEELSISQPVFDGDFDDVVMVAPTVEEMDQLWKSLLRYGRNIVATGRIFTANVSVKQEQIIEYLMDQDPDSRTDKEKAILFLALLEHAVVEFEHLLQNRSKDEGVTDEESAELLSDLAKEYRLNLVYELKNNRILFHPTIFHVTLLVLMYVGAKDSTILSVVSFVKPKSRLWTGLDRLIESYDSAGEDSEQFSSPVSVPAVLPEVNTLQEKPQQEYSAGVFAEGDKLIRQAKDLYVKEEYKKAVALLEGIPQSSPHFGSARSLAAQYSDAAVSELRKEAAQLFQNHVRVNSLQRKITYLRDAEKKLQEAMASYPTSRWLNRVQGNLEVIQAKLETLEVELLSTQQLPADSQDSKNAEKNQDP
ncbi:MAG: hypothetical protein OXC44_06230 [Proteobacteria bacterium]|nr:hypothetical protein [Pseudomonadota bacterium]